MERLKNQLIIILLLVSTRRVQNIIISYPAKYAKNKGIIMHKLLILSLIFLNLWSCSDSNREQKVRAIKTAHLFLDDAKISALTKEGKYSPFSEINNTISEFNEFCNSSLVKNNQNIQELILIIIQERMFNYPHVIEGNKLYNIVKSSIDFPAQYPEISPVFKDLATPSQYEKELYFELAERFLNLPEYKKYTKLSRNVMSLEKTFNKEDDLTARLAKLNEQELNYYYEFVISYICSMADVILGVYDYEVKSRNIAFNMMKGVNAHLGTVKSKIYTSYDKNGCPVYKNPQGEILRKSMMLQQKDGC
jgi:hypothetical protein